MAEVHKSIDKDKNITVIKVNGEFLYDQMIEVVKQFYKGEYTLNLVFDLTEADTTAITTGDILKIIDLGKSRASLRKGGKTAFVMSSKVGFGLARMYEGYSEVKNHPISHQVFRNMDEAKRWLEEG